MEDYGERQDRNCYFDDSTALLEIPSLSTVWKCLTLLAIEIPCCCQKCTICCVQFYMSLFRVEN